MLYQRLCSMALTSLLLLPAANLSATSLEAEIDRALQARCLDSRQTAVRILSVEDGKVIYSRNAETPLLPASIQKVLTTAAALHYLGPEYRFTTQVRYTGERQSNRITGDLVLRGGGDPFLRGEDLWNMADNLKRSGITQIEGGIIADVHLFDAYDRAPSWDEQRTQRAYDAKIGALSLNLNTISVHALPGVRVGDPLRVWLEPAPAYMQLDNQGLTMQDTKDNRGRSSFWATRQAIIPVAQNKDGVLPIEVHGRLPIGAEEQVGFINVDNPARYTAESFRYFLNKAGIQVRGATQISQQMVSSISLYQHTSVPLSMVLKELNTYSSNFIAEQILKTIAAERVQEQQPASHAQALQQIIAFLQQAGISTDGLNITDGSGLSRQNRFTAHAMTDLLRYMYPRFDVGPDFISSLRVMGARGAHSRRLKNSPARGQVRGKTGTLNGVSTLTGYVPDQQGKVYAFAFFLSNNSCGYSGADQIEDAILKAVFESNSAPANHAPVISSMLTAPTQTQAK